MHRAVVRLRHRRRRTAARSVQAGEDRSTHARFQTSRAGRFHPWQDSARPRPHRRFPPERPSDGAKVSQETVAYLSYDDDNLYAIFICKEDKQTLRARMSKRDDI